MKLFADRSVREMRALSLQVIFLPGALFLAILSAEADFNPGWGRWIAYAGVVAGVSIAIYARMAAWVSTRFTTRVIIATLGLTALIGLTVQPAAIGVLTAFVFLGTAVGAAAFLRLRAAVWIIAACTVLGLITIFVRSSIPAVAIIIFVALMSIISLVVLVMRQSLQAARDEAVALSLTDALTGLPNRRAMESNIPVLISLAERTGQYAGCLLIDLDHFKAVNDTFGHQTGDVVLRAVADALRSSTRESDVCVRLGGDEFCVFTVVSTINDLLPIAERVRSAIEHLDVTPGMTASVGGAATSGLGPGDGHDGRLDDLMRQADRALYDAKATGRNLIRIR